MADTSTFSGFREPILRAVANQSYRRQPVERTRVMRTLNFTKAVETMREWSSLGLAQPKPELEPIRFDDPRQGNSKEYTSQVHGLAYRFSYEAEEDDKYGVVVGTISSMGDSFRETEEILASRVWNAAFAADSPATEELTFDGLPVIAATHTLGGTAATQSNLTTGDVGLAFLQAARYHFRNLRNAQGFRNQAHKLAYIMIAPDATTEPLLDQCLGGSGMQPFTADNTPHELGGDRAGIGKIVYSYLSDTDRTFAMSGELLSGEFGPFWAWRRQLSMKSWEDESVQASCHAGSMRWSRGFPSWLGVFGSAG